MQSIIILMLTAPIWCKLVHASQLNIVQSFIENVKIQKKNIVM